MSESKLKLSIAIAAGRNLAIFVLSPLSTNKLFTKIYIKILYLVYHTSSELSQITRDMICYTFRQATTLLFTENL